MTRREMLLALLGGATALGQMALGPTGRALAGAPGLGALAARSGRFFGCAVHFQQLDADREFREAVLRECSILTPELELKWAAIEPERGTLSLTMMDDLASFARSHGLRLYGHTLLWHMSVPSWADSLLREEKDWTLVRRHIASIVPRFAEMVDYWDVVNEPIQTGNRTDGLRTSVFFEAFGQDYIRMALEEARTFHPEGRLMINEYGLEYDSPDEDGRRYHLLKLLERLRHEGAPLDGLGMQAHLDLGKGPLAADKLRHFMEQVADLGLEIVVTELDVREADYAIAASARDQAVADETRRYLEIVLAEPAVSGLSTWGLSDRYSWLTIGEEELAAYEGVWGNDGGPGLNRGLPLNASLERKPMYDAIAETLAALR